jgi:hypothetical protein
LFILTQHWHAIRVILPFENILLAVSVLLFELLTIEALVLTNLSRAVSSCVSCTHSPGATPAIEPQLNGGLFNITQHTRSHYAFSSTQQEHSQQQSKNRHGQDKHKQAKHHKQTPHNITPHIHL